MSRFREYSMQRFRRPAEPVSDEELELSPADAVDNVFTASLHNIIPEDIELKKKSSAKKMNSGALIRRITLIFCVAVFVVCAIYLVYNTIEKWRGNAYYENMANNWNNIFGEEDEGDGAVSRLTSLKGAQNILCLKDRLNAGETFEGGESNNSNLNEMRATLAAYIDRNPDTYGWVYVEGTTINHPLVQSTDNDYYLDHGFDGRDLVNGSIFVDYRCNKSVMRNFNTVLYGHNLTGGGMFHDVETCFYRDEEKFRNSKIYIYTMEGAYIFEPFAVYDTVSTYHYFRTEFATTQLFVDFAYELQSNSIYEKEMEFKATDRIITFSTCTNRSTNGRYALHAKLVQVIH